MALEVYLHKYCTQLVCNAHNFRPHCLTSGSCLIANVLRSNRRGVIVASDAFAAQQTSNFLAETISPNLVYEHGNEARPYLPPVPESLNKPVDIGSNMKEKEVFYPLRNRDFRNWRDVKKRGGDLMIFSNFEKIKLPAPISIDLDEVCREYKQ